MLWGLDPVTGEFHDEEHTTAKVASADSEVQETSWLTKLTGLVKGKKKQTVQSLLMTELEKLQEEMEQETEKFKTEYQCEKEKGKRLLFLFQKDLMPGISGQILESKGQRDEVVVQGVSRSAKILAWLFLGTLNLCMLFYVFLFAVSQDPYRQKAWAKSFGMWLVMEVIVVSSFTVCFMHVFIPSITMKDVSKIRTKLIDSVVKYHKAMADKEAHRGLVAKEKAHAIGVEAKDQEEELLKQQEKERREDEDDVDDDFNAARYLFLSYRLANLYPDIKVAQIVRQFSTPWPRQSYHRATDMNKKYNRKFSALTRSISMVAMFFLSNLLTVPLAVQDMIMQVLTTTATGYTILLHVQLYKIYPVLVAIPMIFLAAIIHFFVQSNKSQAKIELAKMLKGSKEREQAELEKKRLRKEKKRKARMLERGLLGEGRERTGANDLENQTRSWSSVELSSDSDSEYEAEEEVQVDRLSRDMSSRGSSSIVLSSESEAESRSLSSADFVLSSESEGDEYDANAAHTHHRIHHHHHRHHGHHGTHEHHRPHAMVVHDSAVVDGVDEIVLEDYAVLSAPTFVTVDHFPYVPSGSEDPSPLVLSPSASSMYVEPFAIPTLDRRRGGERVHVNRRQSVQQGIAALRLMKRAMQQEEVEDDPLDEEDIELSEDEEEEESDGDEQKASDADDEDLLFDLHRKLSVVPSTPNPMLRESRAMTPVRVGSAGQLQVSPVTASIPPPLHTGTDEEFAAIVAQGCHIPLLSSSESESEVESRPDFETLPHNSSAHSDSDDESDSSVDCNDVDDPEDKHSSGSSSSSSSDSIGDRKSSSSSSGAGRSSSSSSSSGGDV